MNESFQAWESYYVIVGSSAGALTGLQFVVLTLITEAGMVSDGGEALAAYGSPNVVHFCAALLVSAIMSIPWHGTAGPGFAIGACGIAGLVYSAAVLRRALRVSGYKPVLEDWIWHAALPIFAYVLWLVAGITLPHRSAIAPFEIGGGALLLVFVGIHNAWDTVMYVTLERSRARQREREARRAADASHAPAGEGVKPLPEPPPGQPMRAGEQPEA